MAVNVDDINLIAARTVDAYKEAELQILAIVRDHLARGIDAPTWAQERLTAVVSLRRAAEQVMTKLSDHADLEFRAAVAQAYRNGRGGATVQVPGPLGAAAKAARTAVPRVEVIDSLSSALIRDVGERQLNVLRNVEDVYRQVQAAAVARSVAGGVTRREASQAAWQGFVDQGVTSFTDRSGRVWRLTSYVEMAVRTVTMRAAVQGQLDRLDTLGIDLVIVSDEAGECARCRPWEGKILSIAGPPGPRTLFVESETEDAELGPTLTSVQATRSTEGATTRVEVAGSLVEARLAGLLHPNCGHTVRAFQPGATRVPKGPTADPEHNLAKDRQRAIERAIRHYKEREAAALTPEAKRAAAVKVRQWQAVMRQHLKDNPKLKRLAYREEIGAGNLPPGGAASSPAGRLLGPPPPKLTGGTADARAARRAAARERQRDIDRADAVAQLAAEVDEVIGKATTSGVSDEDLAALLRSRLHATSVDQADLTALTAAVDAGDWSAVQAAAVSRAAEYGLTPIGRYGELADYDPDVHQLVEGVTVADGVQVLVIRQGHTYRRGSETIQLDRPVVTPATHTTKTATKVDKKAKEKTSAVRPEDLTIPQLLALGKQHGVLGMGGRNKIDLIAHIRSWEEGREPILPGTAERRAAEKAARAAKAAADAAAKQAADVAFAAATSVTSPRNPATLTGPAGDKWWTSLSDDTGTNPVPIRNLTLGVGSYQYTIVSGSAYRIQGVVYLVEDGTDTVTPIDAIVRGLWEVHQTLPPDGIQHQRGYAWLAGRNPADAYWERQYNTPGFTSGATAGDGGTHIWNIGTWTHNTPVGMAHGLRHEFGHNMSSAVARDGMHDSGQRWAAAGAADEAHAAQVTIVTIKKDAHSSHQITLTSDPSAGYPRGVSEYGKSAPAEDFAESVRLYLAGQLGTAQLTPGGPETPFWFRDVWPARAAHLDRLMPRVAAEQKASLAKLGR